MDNIATTGHNVISLLKISTLCEISGRSRSGTYEDIASGLMTKPVKLGTSSVWPAHEVDAINRARIAGSSDDEIRLLVKSLEKSRKAMAPKVKG